jgi:hypothetical protein
MTPPGVATPQEGNRGRAHRRPRFRFIKDNFGMTKPLISLFYLKK